MTVVAHPFSIAHFKRVQQTFDGRAQIHELVDRMTVVVYRLMNAS